MSVYLDILKQTKADIESVFPGLTDLQILEAVVAGTATRFIQFSKVGETKAKTAAAVRDWRSVQIHFGKDKGTSLGRMDARKLSWYQNTWQPKPYNGSISPDDQALVAALDASRRESAATVQMSSENLKAALAKAQPDPVQPEYEEAGPEDDIPY
jgi:hypothetical protein